MTHNAEYIEKMFKRGFNVLDQYKHMEVSEIKAQADSDRLPFAVMCLNLERDLNIATIVRSSHAFGAERVYTIGWNKVDARGMVGCQHYTNFEKVRITQGDTEELIKGIKDICDEHGYTPLFAEWNEHSKCVNDESFEDFVKTHRPLLIMGNEGEGVPKELMEAFGNKNIFHINQRGVIRSLNVSNAASVFLYRLETILGK